MPTHPSKAQPCCLWLGACVGVGQSCVGVWGGQGGADTTKGAWRKSEERSEGFFAFHKGGPAIRGQGGWDGRSAGWLGSSDAWSEACAWQAGQWLGSREAAFPHLAPIVAYGFFGTMCVRGFGIAAGCWPTGTRLGGATLLHLLTECVYMACLIGWRPPPFFAAGSDAGTALARLHPPVKQPHCTPTQRSRTRTMVIIPPLITRAHPKHTGQPVLTTLPVAAGDRCWKEARGGRPRALAAAAAAAAAAAGVGAEGAACCWDRSI